MKVMGERGEIDVAPFREAALEAIANGATWSELAFRMGYVRKDKRTANLDGKAADITRLKRRLGVVDEYHSNGRRYRTKGISYEIAVRVVKALERDPVDFGV